MNKQVRYLLRIIVLILCVSPGRDARPADSPPPYQLNQVVGMEYFHGSAAAKQLLARNGFVVADPHFKQIFEPYIKAELPLFITTDSAWHTYHVLLEEGVKQLEEIQSRRLSELSRLLWGAAKQKSAGGDQDFAALASYASLGLAFQDASHRALLPASEKSILKTLNSGTGTAAVPIGLPLLAANFRAASFYTQSPELADYFAARQWYATVLFRLQDARETRLAFKLIWLINSNPELLDLWRKLSTPYDLLLASPEDGNVRSYGNVAKRLLGETWTPPEVANRIAELQRELALRLSTPRINDQLLAPAEYARFGQVTKGFRLLPPRQLPCAITFHQTTDPQVRGRLMPSGLDFLVASPTLRSTAAVRALEAQCGREVTAAAQQFNCEPFPDSLHGEAMKLLGLLQKPLPAQVPPALRTEAWADQQLWTQLGAWAEQRHTWALHTKLSVEYMGGSRTPAGMVAPYPEFFAGLAQLTRKTATALEQVDATEPFSVRSTATNMLAQIRIFRRLITGQGQSNMNKNEWEQESTKISQLGRFLETYSAKHQDGSQRELSLDKMLANFETMARRVAETGLASESQTEMLRQFADASNDTPVLFKEFATVCDRLAELARKTLAGRALDAADSEWVSHYGTTLAKFHFYDGNSYLVPRDDFPIVTRVFANPLTSSILYAGLARPQALYVIVPGGRKLRLHRGAVLTYREFARDAQSPLDDESWRKLTSTGQTPPPPMFTRSFLAETGAKELIKELRRGIKRAANSEDDKDSESVELKAQMLQTRATAADLSSLYELLRKTAGAGEFDQVGEELMHAIARLATPTDLTNLLALLPHVNHEGGGMRDRVMVELARTIARLPWESEQPRLISWLANSRPDLAAAAAHVLASRPQVMDVQALVANFESQPPRTRRLYCVLFGKTLDRAEARETLLRALQDRDDGVRWQAVLAIYQGKWKDTRSVSGIVNRLGDTNEFVAAAAAYSLGRLGATEAAPALLERLKTRAASTPLPHEQLESHAKAIEQSGMEDSFRTLQVDSLRTFAPRGNRRISSLLDIAGRGKFPYFPSHLRGLEEFTFDRAIIDALSDLNYQPAAEVLRQYLGSDSHKAALLALRKLDAGGLERALYDIALDRKAEGAKRGQALSALCELGAKDRVRDLLPLLEETTIIVPTPRHPDWNWRLCDHAASAMGRLLDWEFDGKLVTEPAQREVLTKKLRQWAKSQP